MKQRFESLNLAARRITSQLMLVFLIVALVGFLGLFLWQSLQIQKVQAEFERKQADLIALQERNNQLQEHLDFHKGPGHLLYVEKVAREALGMVKPGETLVLPVAENAPTVAASPVVATTSGQLSEKSKTRSNWQNWLQFFFGT